MKRKFILEVRKTLREILNKLEELSNLNSGNNTYMNSWYYDISLEVLYKNIYTSMNILGLSKITKKQLKYIVSALKLLLAYDVFSDIKMSDNKVINYVDELNCYI